MLILDPLENQETRRKQEKLTHLAVTKDQKQRLTQKNRGAIQRLLTECGNLGATQLLPIERGNLGRCRRRTFLTLPLNQANLEIPRGLFPFHEQALVDAWYSLAELTVCNDRTTISGSQPLALRSFLAQINKDQ